TSSTQRAGGVATTFTPPVRVAELSHRSFTNEETTHGRESRPNPCRRGPIRWHDRRRAARRRSSSRGALLLLPGGGGWRGDQDRRSPRRGLREGESGHQGQAHLP